MSGVHPLLCTGLVRSSPKDKDREEVMKGEFKETRETTQQGFSTSTTYVVSANNVLVQRGKENLKSQIKAWRINQNEKKKGYW